MPSTGYQSPQAVEQAVQNGTLPRGILDERVKTLLRSIRTACRHRIQRTSSCTIEQLSDDHHALAAKAAARSFVLLKNENRLLPLPASVKAGFVGSFGPDLPMQGAGSAHVIPTRAESLRSCLQRILPEAADNAVFVQGYSHDGNQKQNAALAKEALEKTKDCDVIVFLCSLPGQENLEGLDRRMLFTPEPVRELLQAFFATGKPVAALIASASAIGMEWADQASAIVRLGLAGQGVQEAAAKLVYGLCEPRGALAQTIAYLWSDHPTSARFHEQSPIHVHREDLDVGYRYFSSQHIEVRYPFGYGLTYGNFDIVSARLDDSGISFEVFNDSERPASRPVQLYVQRSGADEVRELKGFLRVDLQGHERKQGFIPFDEEAFLQFDPVSGKMISGCGCYEVFLGLDVADERFSFTVEKGKCSQEQPGHADSDAEILSVNDLEQSEMDPFHTPLELFENSPSGLLRTVIRILKKRRKVSLNRQKPDLTAIALLDMTFCSMAKTAPQWLSVSMAEDLASHFYKPSEGDWKKFFSHWRAHRKAVKAWKHQEESQFRV